MHALGSAQHVSKSLFSATATQRLGHEGYGWYGSKLKSPKIPKDRWSTVASPCFAEPEKTWLAVPMLVIVQRSTQWFQVHVQKSLGFHTRGGPWRLSDLRMFHATFDPSIPVNPTDHPCDSTFCITESLSQKWLPQKYTQAEARSYSNPNNVL